ncbi:MAG TPA: NlpC/P60 family protein [Acidimicrobiales bacterium]
MRPGCSPRRLLAGVTLVGLLALPVLAPATASADQISDKKAEAQQVAAKLSELNHKLDALDEQYNQATIELKSADAAVAAAQQKVDETNVQLEAKTTQLRSFAVEAYVTGNDTPTFEAVLTSTAEVASQKQSYLEAASGSRQDLVDELQATKQDVADQVTKLTEAQQRSQQLRDSLKSSRQQADAAVAEQQQISSSVQGELATLVAAEQQRQAEARAAEAAAAAAAQAQAQAQAQLAATRAATPVAPAVTPPRETKPPGTPITIPDPTTPDPGSGSPTPGAGIAIAAAQSALGVPYVWAGADMNGFDCSGLMLWAWAKAGRSLPHSSSAQYGMTRHIPLSQLLPGDLVFFDGLGHVGLYIGGGMMIHAPHTGDVVRVGSIYGWSTPLAGRL